MARIQARLDELRRLEPGRYECKPALREPEILALEASFGVALPLELRAFLGTVHGGGAGPGYGLHVEADEVSRPRRAREFPFDDAVADEAIAERMRGGRLHLEGIESPGNDDDYPPG